YAERVDDVGYSLFDTAIGRCAIAWNTRGIAAVHLPERSEAQTRARVMRRCPGAREIAPPPTVRAAIDRIAALLDGERADLTMIELDMTAVPEFNRRVYEVA